MGFLVFDVESKLGETLKALNTEDLVVVGDDLAEERRVAAASSGLTRTAEGESVDVGGGGKTPRSVSRGVGVAGLEERLVAGLHL